jgi:hypothetical protein
MGDHRLLPASIVSLSTRNVGAVICCCPIDRR